MPLSSRSRHRSHFSPFRLKVRAFAVYHNYEIDQTLVTERAAQFREQVARYHAGKLSEDEFRALRLRNGLYMQRFAPMLRINVPYGHLNAAQLRRLGHITRKYSKGYGHFTTRQNVQLNWPQQNGRAHV